MLLILALIVLLIKFILLIMLLSYTIVTTYKLRLSAILVSYLKLKAPPVVITAAFSGIF